MLLRKTKLAKRVVSKPPFSRRDGRYLTRTNRTVYFGTKVTPQFDETIRRLADEQGCLLTEMLERFMEAYQAQEQKKVASKPAKAKGKR